MGILNNFYAFMATINNKIITCLYKKSMIHNQQGYFLPSCTCNLTKLQRTHISRNIKKNSIKDPLYFYDFVIFMGTILNIYSFLLFLRVLLSWFPSIDWGLLPLNILIFITEPFFLTFRGLVPPIMGQLDLSPMIGFYLLQMLHAILSAYNTGEKELW